MDTILQDLRYALRGLAKNPGFATIAVLALALGIGANVAIFSAVDAILIRPLPYADADRLVMVWEDASFQSFPRNTPAPANYVDWRKQNQVFTDMAAIRYRTANLTGDGTPESVLGSGVTFTFFDVLGVKPMLGRVFTEEEDRKATRVVVLSHPLWVRRFGGDPNLVGRAIQMNGQSTTVVGVMPPGFTFQGFDRHFWEPSGFTPQELAQRGSHYLQVVARLKSGVTVERAQADMSAIAARLEKEYPNTNTKIGAVVVPLRDQITGDTSLALIVLLGAAGCVLLIACANVANLLLARATARRREMAVRSALGAGSGRLVRQMITESLLLSTLGGALGLGLARLSLTVLQKMIPAGFAAQELALEGRLLAFAFAVSWATGLVFGLVPALQASHWSMVDALKQGGRGGVGARHHLFRSGLVVSEVALSAVLLVSAGLLIQTLVRLRGLDPGFDTANLLTMITGLPNPKYAEAAKRDAFVVAVLDKVKAIPGVKDAAFASNLPFTAMGNTVGFIVDGQPAAGPGENRDIMARVGTTGYLKMLGVRLKEGRFFTDDDREGMQQVVIVNEFFARQFFPNQSAVGKRIKAAGQRPEDPWRVIVGVVSDMRERGYELPQKYAVYASINQWRSWRPTYLAVRTAGNPSSIAGAVRQAIWSADRDQPVARIRTMEEILDAEVSNRKLQMQFIAAFAGLALVLASLGLYGVLSYGVAQRTQEIGVRIALGASPGGVAGMVVRQGTRLALLGTVIGAIGALAVTRAFQKLLFGVAAADPLTYGGVCAALLAVAVAACYIPARRASRVDPMVALRQE